MCAGASGDRCAYRRPYGSSYVCSCACVCVRERVKPRISFFCLNSHRSGNVEKESPYDEDH